MPALSEKFLALEVVVRTVIVDDGVVALAQLQTVLIVGCLYVIHFLWTEFIQTWDEVEYMLLPRLFALSCLAWDADDRPDYDTFLKDVQLHQIPILNAWGFNYRNK